MRASQYFSADTTTDSSISSINNNFILDKVQRNIENVAKFSLKYTEEDRAIRNYFKTRPEHYDNKSYIGLETVRGNYFKSNFPPTISRPNSVSSSEVGKVDTDEIATSRITSGKLLRETLV